MSRLVVSRNRVSKERRARAGDTSCDRWQMALLISTRPSGISKLPRSTNAHLLLRHRAAISPGAPSVSCIVDGHHMPIRQAATRVHMSNVQPTLVVNPAAMYKTDRLYMTKRWRPPQPWPSTVRRLEVSTMFAHRIASNPHPKRSLPRAVWTNGIDHCTLNSVQRRPQVLL